jgi:mannose-6-phosphate isomerase
VPAADVPVTTPNITEEIVMADRGRADQSTVAQIVTKPWGQEEIWAHEAGLYCGKRITVNAGQALSLQYHEQKHETMFVVAGSGSIDLGPVDGDLERHSLTPGDVVRIPVGLVHRLAAAADQQIVVMEASTTQLSDVVRLEDRYGRADEPHADA